jgi:hypothetical protein
LGNGDAAAAYALMRGLIAAPRESVAALDRRLQAAPPIDGTVIDRLIADLDSGRFEVRERASQRLGELGEITREALTKARSGKPSAEARARIKELLDALDSPADGERLQLLRAVEVLEAIGTPEARRVLKRLAGGEPKAMLTREAKAALERLDPSQ